MEPPWHMGAIQRCPGFPKLIPFTMYSPKLHSILAIATTCLSLAVISTGRSQVVETGRSVPIQTETTVTTTGPASTGLVSQVTTEGFMIRTQDGKPARFFDVH